MSGPTVHKVTRRQGVAGFYALEVRLSYPGESVELVTFSSSSYGGPIVMSTAGNPSGIFVASAVLDRIGSELDAGWVSRFLGVTE